MWRCPDDLFVVEEIRGAIIWSGGHSLFFRKKRAWLTATNQTRRCWLVRLQTAHEPLLTLQKNMSLFCNIFTFTEWWFMHCLILELNKFLFLKTNMVHALFETALVNYVASGSLPTATHFCSFNSLFCFLCEKTTRWRSDSKPPRQDRRYRPGVLYWREQRTYARRPIFRYTNNSKGYSSHVRFGGRYGRSLMFLVTTTTFTKIHINTSP